MDIESILREARTDQLVKPLGFVTEAGKKQFHLQLRKMTPAIGILQRRQDAIVSLRNSLDTEKKEKIEKLFQTISELEPQLGLFQTKTEVEKNSYEQLLFSGWPALQVLNTIPFVLLLVSIFKQYIVPALAVLTPLFMVCMPFFFLKYWYNLPISVEQYTKILFGVLGMHTLDLKNPRTILQGSLTLFSLGQSIYQPIQNALHLQAIHKELMRVSQASIGFIQCFQELRSSLSMDFKDPLESMDLSDPHRVFAELWDHPFQLQLALQTLGDCEVVYRLAIQENLRPVRFYKGNTPHLVIRQGIDPTVSNCIPFNLRLTGNHHHAILTGPNRGGKSSVLRNTVQTIVLAQTFGLGFTTGSIELRPFDWVASGLRLEDRPGSTSMFESEVDFAIQILQKAKHSPKEVGCILFDELFHSTNPPDGARTAGLFLEKLWATSNTASFISTHVFSLAKKANKRIQKLCVPAHRTESGELKFTYTLKEGICEVSSVDEILKEKGLMD